MSLKQTPIGERIHISFFGKTNSGKSSIINSLTNQEISIVSDIKGTTTDPVLKSMEIIGVGACVLIDTAGFDDDSELGIKRIEKTKQILQKSDIAVVIFSDENIEEETKWILDIKSKNIPLILVLNKIDTIKNYEHLQKKIEEKLNQEILCVSAKDKTNINKILDSIKEISEKIELDSICGHLVKDNDTVLLVMPQDIQAPKGRLILPQVQTIRDLLELKCIVICTTTDKFSDAINKLKNPPNLIIVDSQIFGKIYPLKPKDSLLTSFSVLFSRYKGDINEFIIGANAIDNLKDNDYILIAEACTHNPQDGDIARVKLPNMLKKKTGKELKIDICSGNNFPKNLSKYSLIIHCGACMFNKKYVLNRIDSVKKNKVPITNYGIAIAHMLDILDKIEK